MEGLMLKPRAPKVSGLGTSYGRRRVLSPEGEERPVCGVVDGFRGMEGRTVFVSSDSKSFKDGLRCRRDQSSSSVCLRTGICLPLEEGGCCCLSVG